MALLSAEEDPVEYITPFFDVTATKYPTELFQKDWKNSNYSDCWCIQLFVGTFPTSRLKVFLPYNLLRRRFCVVQN